MRFGQVGKASLWLVALASVAIAGCGSATKALVTVTPNAPTVLIGTSLQFTATVTGVSSTSVTWGVSQGNETTIIGGNNTIGTIDTDGLYTAPVTVPSPKTVKITATSTANTNDFGTATVTVDSGVRVRVIPATYTCNSTAALPSAITMQVSEDFQFIACVTGSLNTGVTWSVNGIAGGNTTIGTISGSGLFTAPDAAESAVTITATSAADSNESGNYTVDVGANAVPNVTSLVPSSVPQGSIQQDIYMIGKGFFTTSTVVLNGAPSANVTTTYLSSTLLRARIAAPALSAAALMTLGVESQDGDQSAAATLTVYAVKPALLALTPNTLARATSPSTPTVTLTGGFYTPSTVATFDGNPMVANPQTGDPRHLNIGLTGPELGIAGLYSVVVRNLGIITTSSSEAATNLAVSDLTSDIPTAATATVPLVGDAAATAVAINAATATAVVVNTGDNSISLVNLDALPTSAPATIPVGNHPTGVAVDDILNLALVVNSVDNTVSVVNLATASVQSTLPLSGFTPVSTQAGVTIAPYSIAINSLTHRGIVVNSTTNTATIIDLITPNPNSTPACGTPPCALTTVGGTLPSVSTGLYPEVAVDPTLNWAIVTPGGAGTITIVDLGRPATPGDGGKAPVVIATMALSTTVQGVAVNSQTHAVLVTDPSNTTSTIFNALDFTTQSYTQTKTEIAAAINPLTNTGVTVNAFSGLAHIANLSTGIVLQTVSVGANPQAVAVDAGSNQAVVVNQGNGPGTSSLTILSLGPVRPLQIVESSPDLTFATASPVTLTVTGHGFTSGSVIRLDGTALPTSTVPAPCPADCRQLTATVPVTMLGTPRRYVVDVQNVDLTLSDVGHLTAILPVSVPTAPTSVAVDTNLELAVVASQGDCSVPGSVSIIDLTTGMINATLSIGTCPTSVTVLPALGLAAVTTTNDNQISVVDYVNQVVLRSVPTCSGCTQPMGVAMNTDTQTAVIANYGTNNVSSLAMVLGAVGGGEAVLVDQQPIAVGVDYVDDVALVATTYPPAAFDFIDLATVSLAGRISGVTGPAASVYDPVSSEFLAAESDSNRIDVIDPLTEVLTTIRAGIDPTSIDYNPQSGTAVTVNPASSTVSVVDYQGQQVVYALGLGGSPMFSVAIDPSTNIGVLADLNNNRVLLVPLPQ
jgi:DNA-binding beta-propeller fold protein YncE